MTVSEACVRLQGEPLLVPSLYVVAADKHVHCAINLKEEEIVVTKMRVRTGTY